MKRIRVTVSKNQLQLGLTMVHRQSIFKMLIRCFIMLVLALQSSCCGDIFSDSPHDLLEKNEHVFLGKLVSQQSILKLGTVNYYDNRIDFAIFEYRYIPLMTFKGANSDTIDMWVCHKIGPVDRQNLLHVEVGDSVLVYGKEVRKKEDLVWTMRAMTRVQDILTLFETGRIERFPWHSLDTDTTLASRIMANVSLSDQLEQRILCGKVLHPTDLYMWTTKEFLRDQMCFQRYPQWDAIVDKKEYLFKLSSTAVQLFYPSE